MIGRLLTAALLTCVLAIPARADEPLVTYKALSPAYATKLAQTAMESCRKPGYQVAVAVVDRSGVLQVLLRDRYAGPHTPDTAWRKARTAVSFRTDTSELDKLAQPGTKFFGLRFIDGALALGGGVTVRAAGSLVGGVGVSGAPGGDADEACAKAGIAAIEGDINF